MKEQGAAAQNQPRSAKNSDAASHGAYMKIS